MKHETNPKEKKRKRNKGKMEKKKENVTAVYCTRVHCCSTPNGGTKIPEYSLLGTWPVVGYHLPHYGSWMRLILSGHGPILAIFHILGILPPPRPLPTTVHRDST